MKIIPHPLKAPQKWLLTAILYCLLCSQGIRAAETTETDQQAPLPGRYVLITQGDAVFDPVILSISKKNGEFVLSVEDQRFTEPTIKTDSGSIIFQVTKKGRDLDPHAAGDTPKEYIVAFAGVPSTTSEGAISGAFSSLYYYHKAGSPGATTGTFLLFPIDKK
jgi:hypothetical protein